MISFNTAPVDTVTLSVSGVYSLAETNTSYAPAGSDILAIPLSLVIAIFFPITTVAPAIRVAPALTVTVTGNKATPAGL